MIGIGGDGTSPTGGSFWSDAGALVRNLSASVSSPLFGKEKVNTPIEDGSLMAENPWYWRSRKLPEANQLWDRVQGLQERLCAGGIEVDNYVLEGKAMKYIDIVDVDTIRPSAEEDHRILPVQLIFIRNQSDSLEGIWSDNVLTLGKWEHSPYRPKDQPSHKKKGKGRGNTSPDKSLTAPDTSDKITGVQSTEKDKPLYMGEETG